MQKVVNNFENHEHMFKSNACKLRTKACINSAQKLINSGTAYLIRFGTELRRSAAANSHTQES
jgi:hypothetical protein